MEISNKGLTGEFYVLAQLNARGYNASLTLGNTKSVDILVMNNKTNKGFKVEVKTTTNKPIKEKLFAKWHNDNACYNWILSKKNETYIDDNLIYCFVHISDLNVMPKFFLVHSKDVANYVKSQHKFYLSTRKNKVSDSSMRKFRVEINDPNKYQNNWGIFDK